MAGRPVDRPRSCSMKKATAPIDPTEITPIHQRTRNTKAIFPFFGLLIILLNVVPFFLMGVNNTAAGISNVPPRVIMENMAKASMIGRDDKTDGDVMLKGTLSE